MAKKKMTSYRAVGLAEGFETGTEKEVQQAWQQLEDTGMAYRLQGWFGRNAQAMIDAGYIKPRNRKLKKKIKEMYY